MHLKRKMGVIRNQVEGLRKKKAQLQEALAGQLDPIYRLLLRQHMEQVNQLRQHVEEIEVLTVAQTDHTAALVRLTEIPGGGPVCRPGTVGGDRAWGGGVSERRTVCLVGGGLSGQPGNRYLRRLLCQIAWAAVRTKDTFFAGLFARLLPRVEGKGAAWAVAHRVAKVIWMLLHNGVEYQEKGPAPANPRLLARKMRRLLQECARAGIDAKSLMPQTVPATV
jgi:transposase